MCKYCEKEAKSRGMCMTHYMREYRKSGGTCKECTRTVYSRGLCESHYKSLLREENPSYDTAQRELLKITHSRLSPMYKEVHRNITKAKGKAREYSCVDCGGTADEWSLNKESSIIYYGIPDRQTYPYSLNLEDYAPRCRKCHGFYDKIA